MEIALTHLVRALGAIRGALQMEVTVINVTVEEYIANAFALVTRRMKAFFLRKPERWVRCPNTNDPRIGQFFTIVATKNNPQRCGFIPPEMQNLRTSNMGSPSQRSSGINPSWNGYREAV